MPPHHVEVFHAHLEVKEMDDHVHQIVALYFGTAYVTDKLFTSIKYESRTLHTAFFHEGVTF